MPCKAIANDAFEREAPHLRGLEQLGVEGGHLSARPFDAIAQRGVELGLRHRLPGDSGDDLLLVADEAAVALDAEEDERGEDEQEQHDLERARVPAEEIEHRG